MIKSVAVFTSSIERMSQGGMEANALLDLEHAHQLGYPAATFGLATVYYLGDDVTQDLDKARLLFINSYENGVCGLRGASLFFMGMKCMGTVTLKNLRNGTIRLPFQGNNREFD